MFVDINLKAPAVALILPIGNFVPQAIEIRIAPKVEIANQHAAEMADVAHLAVADAERAKERYDGHRGDDPFHFDGDWNRKQVCPAVGKQDCAGNQDTENRAGSADGGYVRIIAAPKVGKIVDDDVDQSRADAREKVIAKKTIATPDEFDFAAEHPKHEHVEKDVPNIRDCVQEKIGEGLPNA